MRVLLRSALVAGACLLGVTQAGADVTISISDGYVSVEAKDATVRQILSEWARVGQTRIVNGERIAGAPLTLHLVRVPEAQALDILLRSVSGYMAAPRAVPVPNASRFDRILVMPASAPPRIAQAPVQPAQAFQAPVPSPSDDMDIEEPGAVPPPGGGPPQRGPIFPQYPNPVNGQAPGAPPQRGPVFPPSGFQPRSFPNQAGAPVASPPAPAATPGAPTNTAMPVGVATPGMLVQPPQNTPPEPQE